MATADPIAPEPRRLSIRIPHWGWFLLAATLLVVGFVAVSVWLPWHREQQLVEKMKPLGVRFQTENGAPGWLRRLVGDKALRVFDRVIIASSPHSFVPTDCLPDLKTFEHLKELDLISSWKTDADIAQVCEMKKLRHLVIFGITNEQLERLKDALPHCEINYELQE